MKPPPTIEELLASLNREVPFSDDAEKGVISCVLQRPELMADAPAPSTLYHAANRLVFAAMVDLANHGRPFDPITLTHSLREQGKLETVGDGAAISELFAFVPIPSHFAHYKKIVMEKFALREIITASCLNIQQAQDHGKEGEDDVTVVMDEAARRLQDAREIAAMEESAELPTVPIRELVAQVLEDAETMAHSGKKMAGLSTGIDAIDSIMGGLEPGCLTVIAAESSDGKSSLCRQMLESVASEGHQAVDYTYEMMPKTEARRVLCSQGRIDAKSLKMGILTRGEQMALASHAGKVSRWDMHIVDVAGKTIEAICRDIARRCRKLPQGKKIVAMIDYIQLCKTAAASKNREREVAHITATAKQCAKMTGAHILMPSQQNKEGEVRESMAIEQDCDNLIQIQKIEGKAGGKKPAWKQDDEKQEPNNRRRIFFKKLRDGERYASVMMELRGQFYRFDLIPGDDPFQD
jgi:replicative DNA helicase